MKKKICWLAKEGNKGWSLYLCLGEKLTFPLKTVYFKSEKDVKTAIKSNIVFVHKG